LENRKGNYHLVNLGVDGTIIRDISEENGVKTRAEYIRI
jgi:hypothetical protein